MWAPHLFASSGDKAEGQKTPDTVNPFMCEIKREHPSMCALLATAHQHGEIDSSCCCLFNVSVCSVFLFITLLVQITTHVCNKSNDQLHWLLISFFAAFWIIYSDLYFPVWLPQTVQFLWDGVRLTNLCSLDRVTVWLPAGPQTRLLSESKMDQNMNQRWQLPESGGKKKAGKTKPSRGSV